MLRIQWTRLICITFLHLLGVKNSFARSYEPGNITLGVLLPIHRAASAAGQGAFSRKCGDFWEQYGIHRLQQLYLTLDAINNSSKLLPGIKLGFDVRDSCWMTPVALEQCIDFIRSKIASVDGGNFTTSHSSATSAAVKGHSKGQNCFSNASDPIAALVGPGSSSASVQIQNVLDLFFIPQLGYSATSLELNKKGKNTFFMRVVPSDNLQARAIADIVNHYNWSYVAVVFTDGSYGENGINRFEHHLKATSNTSCIANSEKIRLKTSGAEKDYDDAIRTLISKKAKAVVCFCQGDTVRNLFNATKRVKGAAGRFIWIGSDGWGNRQDVVGGLDEYAAGGISIKLNSPRQDAFDDYYKYLKPHNNTRNPWFRDFWAEKFDCVWSENYRNRKSNDTKNCTGQESLVDDYYKDGQDSKLSLFMNAIYSIAHALDRMWRTECPPAFYGKKLCPKMSPVNGTILRDYLRQVSFKGEGGSDVFFVDGDGPGRYDIMNYQPTNSRPVGQNDTTYGYVQVGSWDSEVLNMSLARMYWPRVGFTSRPVESVCSKPCPVGHKRQVTKSYAEDRPCCWNCDKCESNEIVSDAITSCLKIDTVYIRWSDKDALLCMTFVLIGLLTTAWIAWVFITHNDTAVVKASTRELSYITLVGCAMCYLSSFPFLAKPSLISCYFTRIAPGCSFVLVYGALVTKTNRISRILSGRFGF